MSSGLDALAAAAPLDLGWPSNIKIACENDQLEPLGDLMSRVVQRYGSGVGGLKFAELVRDGGALARRGSRGRQQDVTPRSAARGG